MKANETPSATVAAPVVKEKHYLPLNRLVDHPGVKNRPLDQDWVGQLFESIKASGLDTPIPVWNGGEDAPQMTIKVGDESKTVPSSFIIAGGHRRAALRRLLKEDGDRFKELFPEGVPVVIKSYPTLQELIEARIRENVARKEPSAEELLPLMIQLREDYSMKGKDIAKAIGRSTSFVSQVFDIEQELGEEGVEAAETGKASAKELMKAAKEVKAAKKAGKEVDTKKAVMQAKSKTATLKASGHIRDSKKPSLKKLWGRYKSLPGLNLGRKKEILEQMVMFVIGDASKLPPELKKDSDKPSKTDK
jgi:ParB-like chromosome segregation protein Spo0J